VRNSIVFAILVASNACAARSVPPMVASASLPADFTEIPEGRCSPALDGLFVSYDGANDLIRAFRRQDTDCKIQVIDAHAERDIARARCRECESAKQWSIIAPILSFVGGMLITGAVFIAAGAVK